IYLPAPPRIHTLSLHDALPIYRVLPALALERGGVPAERKAARGRRAVRAGRSRPHAAVHGGRGEGERAQGTCCRHPGRARCVLRSEEHTSELQSRENLVCRLLL